MNAASLAISILALAVAVLAALSGLKSANAAEKSATASLAADRRARQPKLRVELLSPAQAPGDRVIYRVFNEGPEGLDRVFVYRPQPPDGITYGVAATGVDRDFGSEAKHGRLAMSHFFDFTLCCGVAKRLPKFEVVIETWKGDDMWAELVTLEDPRVQRVRRITDFEIPG